MAIHLGRSLPNASRDRPERRRGRPARQHGYRRTACRSYLVLLPVGFALPPPLPAARCALTAPFHPCRPGSPKGADGFGGVFLWHFPWGRPRRGLPGTVLPWSPDFPPSTQDQFGRRAAIRPSGMGRFGIMRPGCQTREVKNGNGKHQGTFSQNRRFSRVATIGKGIMTQRDEKLSRRTMLRNAAAIVGVAGASALTAGCGSSARTASPPAPAPVAPPPPMAEPAPPPPPAAAAKESKREARYQAHPHGRERCGQCAHFVKPHDCELVEGRVSPRGWCTHFTAAG